MARSVSEIQTQIIQEKELRPELDRLTSSSAVAVWRLWIYITAVVIHFHETVFDLFKKEVEDKIAAKEPGTPSWYVERAKEFQAGDNLQVIDGKATYAVINPAKKIVTRAAYRENNDGELLLKVAKGEIGSEAPLSGQELFQLKTYFERIKFAGVKLSILSNNPDRLRLTAEVFYSGIYNSAAVTANVKTAIKDYLKNLDFDGKIYINKIIDVVQKVEGVIDIKINAAVAMVGTTPTTIDRVYETSAGYIIEETDANFTFDDTITYIAQNV
jgi:hypothetical protein